MQGRNISIDDLLADNDFIRHSFPFEPIRLPFLNNYEHIEPSNVVVAFTGASNVDPTQDSANRSLPRQCLVSRDGQYNNAEGGISTALRDNISREDAEGCAASGCRLQMDTQLRTCSFNHICRPRDEFPTEATRGKDPQKEVIASTTSKAEPLPAMAQDKKERCKRAAGSSDADRKRRRQEQNREAQRRFRERRMIGEVAALSGRLAAAAAAAAATTAGQPTAHYAP